MCDVRYTILNQIGTWLVVVTGWLVVHFFTVMRERQKEIRELKSRLVERVLEIEKRSICFHQAQSYSYENGAWLVAEIDRVSKTLSRRPLSSLAVRPEVIKRFRQSITRRNFDFTSFVPQLSNSELIFAIFAGALDLTEELEKAYESRYLDSWWQLFRV